MFGRALVAAGLIFSFSTDLARADSDTLLPITFASLQSDFKKALTAVGVREGVKPEGCLEGDPNKRTVCTFKLGSFMTIMADSKKGEKDIVAITMICGAQTPSDMGKCLLAYMGAMSMATPGLAVESRGKIVSILTSGLEVGNETFVRTEERSYSLQKSIGLWFHIIAADGEGD